MFSATRYLFNESAIAKENKESGFGLALKIQTIMEGGGNWQQKPERRIPN